ncbi:uncharacterized shell protein 13 [Patella vulgata]|uniref:uncharacterized shell protein 13 n=1 Tax=Patella vulgata TaxID=6465 RepID=UPI00217F9E11|nr:uncharacterized shell protein 13 [Patella vulgata]
MLHSLSSLFLLATVTIKVEGFFNFGQPIAGTTPQVGNGGSPSIGFPFMGPAGPPPSQAPMMTLQQARAGPTVEDICTAHAMNPMVGTGHLSDVVGTEITKRAQLLRLDPTLAGTGKWKCAAQFYASKYPATELANKFGDLIDSTGCNRFTCHPMWGPKPIPRGGMMSALLMSSLMGNQPAQPPMFVQPAANPPMFGQPVANLPMVSQPAANPPIAAQPAVNPPMVAQPPPPAQPVSPPVQSVHHPPQQTNGPAPSTNTNINKILENPAFQQQLMTLFSQFLDNNPTRTNNRQATNQRLWGF